jgi:hypothetical protein
VFARSGSSWQQQAYLKASNTDVSDYFGGSVAVDGDTVVVGARREASNATGVNGDQLDNSLWYAGAAYMFARSGGTWTQQTYLKASNTGRLDEFAQSVSVSGDTVVVGAPGEASLATGVNGDQSSNSAQEAGAVYVFSAATPGSYSTFGSGCAATTTPAALSATTLPKINTTFHLRVSNLRPLSPGILLFGFSDTTWNGIPLPLDLAFLGMNGCNLLVSWDLQLWFTPGGGSWDLPLTLPNDPTLAGLIFYNQAWVMDAKANALGVGTSNGGKGVIGY